MALLAGNSGVLSFQWIARQAMVELLGRALPMDQRKIHSIVLQMAAHAVLAVRILHLQLRVVALLFGEQLRDLFVAVQTLECGRTGAEFVAARALCCSTELLVRFGQWTGRNLSIRGSNKEQERGKQRRKRHGEGRP